MEFLSITRVVKSLRLLRGSTHSWAKNLKQLFEFTSIYLVYCKTVEYIRVYTIALAEDTTDLKWYINKIYFKIF